jgi:HAD superfamily hydrolase (TIGR01549 family)
MPQLIPALAHLNPALIIFDKDGTLIDFEAMWAAWAITLAQKLEVITGRSMAERLYRAMDFYADTGQIAPHGQLAVTPMAGLRLLTIQVLVGEVGLSRQVAEDAVAKVWQIPDPLVAAQPLTDLTTLFAALQTCGLKIAVATSDDRAPTKATLAKLGLADFVAALACGDDGIPIKPAPDMVLTLCRTLNIPPAKTIVIGDNVADLHMGRAAGAGLVIGVLSGVSAVEILTPHADIVLPSVAVLVE